MGDSVFVYGLVELEYSLVLCISSMKHALVENVTIDGLHGCNQIKSSPKDVLYNSL